MVLWDKHPTVSPTINPTSEGSARPTHTVTERPLRPTDIMATEHPGIARLPDGTMISVRGNGHIGGCVSETSGTMSDTKNQLGMHSSVSSGLEKNERLHLLSPDTISTSISSHSDLNLIDLAHPPPPVDPKNLHHSDDSIERYTTDLKYGPMQTGPRDPGHGDQYGFSEPSTSPSRPLVVNEMRAGLKKDQITDNLSNGLGKQKNKSISMPSWNHLTAGSSDPRSGPVNRAKLDTNLHRQQARSNAPSQPSHSGYSASESSASSGRGNNTSNLQGNGVSPNTSMRPTSLPLQSHHRGSKKKLMAVYIPQSGPTMKVQTGIAKMDKVAPSCHQVKMAANTHKQQPSHHVIGKLRNGSVKNTCVNQERPRSWAYDSSSGSEHSGEVDHRNGNISSGSASCIAKAEVGKRRGTPFRLLTEKLSVHKKDKKDSKNECNGVSHVNHHPVEATANNSRTGSHQTMVNGDDSHSGKQSELSNGHAGVKLNGDAYPHGGKIANGGAKLQANFELECVWAKRTLLSMYAVHCKMSSYSVAWMSNAFELLCAFLSDYWLLLTSFLWKLIHEYY